MNVLVVNIGSTSFKFRVFGMDDERVLVEGSIADVGCESSRVLLRVGDAAALLQEAVIPNQDAAVQRCIQELGLSEDGGELRVDAVGFKAVHGGEISGAVLVTQHVLDVMESMADAAPAHNPPYVSAMRAFARRRPDLPLVASFETAFHQTIPAARTTYAVPYEWTRDLGVRRYGFHGASHCNVALRSAALLGRDDLRVISCHLGGSSSVCALRAGRSIATSMGMTPQTGLPQNNRVGDFDPYALLTLRRRTGDDFETLLQRMSVEGGLLGISGVSGDMQAILEAAVGGNMRAALAVGVFVESVRHYIGAYLVMLEGLDALVFTGGIGEHSAEIRRRVCDRLEFVGLRLDTRRNEEVTGKVEISECGSKVKVLVVPANEELIVARQTCEVVRG